MGDFLFGQVTFFKVLVHEFFRGFSCRFNHLFAPLFGRGQQVCGNFFESELHALGRFVPNDGLHFAQVNHTREVLFCTDWDDDWHRVGLQAQLHLLDDFEEVGTGTVHLVHKGQTWHFVLVGLTPNSFGLRLNTTHGTVNHASAIQHAHGTLHFNREVDVSGGVNDVDAVLFK